MKNKISVSDLTDFCRKTTSDFCSGVGIEPDFLHAEKAVMYYLGHPTANPAQWHEEWIKLRSAEGYERYERTGEVDGLEVKVDSRMAPLAELDELEQVKYVVFLNMFRTLRQLL